MNKNLKLSLLILGLFVAIILSFNIVSYIQHRGQIAVKVAVLPSDSSLTVDGKVTAAGKLYLTKGSHKLEASRQDFDRDTKNINTDDIQTGTVIYMLPAANSQAARTWLLQHPDVQKQREAAGGAESERLQTILIKKYPIISKLPKENLHYKIDYSVDANQKFSLTITTYGIINGPADYTRYVEQTKAYKQEALDFLKQNGVGPNTYPINYIPNL
ncbi:hypothetical protein KW801_03680 [Candidatus Saccharibacteria bacterium]|nr:hypothetical protein [Candidatus Saccharibacteria bacterium]